MDSPHPYKRIRFAPPLVISEEDLLRAVRIIELSLQDLDKVGFYFPISISFVLILTLIAA